MYIHFIGAKQQGPIIFHTYIYSDRQTNCRPQGVTTSDPVPHGKDILFGDAKFLGRGDIRAHGNKMFSQCRLIINRFQKPGTGSVGVEHGFLSGEGLGRDNKQGGFRPDFFERIKNMVLIDVGNKVDP